MPLQRIDRMTEPPIVGRWNLVPTVRAVYFNHLDDWSVIGGEHEDAEFFNLHWSHYHIDARFITTRQRRLIYASRHENARQVVINTVHSAPLVTTPRVNTEGLPKPVLARRRCSADRLDYPYAYNERVRAVQKHYAGTTCRHGKGGLVCPHRQAPLGSIKPVDGVVTCPLHGLRIDAASGLVLAPEAGGRARLTIVL